MMDFGGLNTQDKKKTLLGVLAKMAATDNVITENELLFILTTAEKMGIAENEVHLITAGRQNYGIDLPETEQDRMVFFFHILSLMQMDSQITPEEKELAQKIGFALAINPDLVNELIHIITTQIDPNIPDEDVGAALLKYLN